MRVLLVVCLLLAACGKQANHGTLMREVAVTPSGKGVYVYQNAGFSPATEPMTISTDAVSRAMRSSSMFFEEDIRVLAEPVAAELARLEDDERIIVEKSDTTIHIYLHAGELMLLSFRQGHEVSRHASRVPSEAVVAAPPPRPTNPAAEEAARRRAAEDARRQAEEDALRRERERLEAERARLEADKAASKDAEKATPADEPKKKKVRKKKEKEKDADPATGKRLSEEEVRAKLKQLDDLRKKDLITEEEYQRKRAELLEQL